MRTDGPLGVEGNHGFSDFGATRPRGLNVYSYLCGAIAVNNNASWARVSDDSEMPLRHNTCYGHYAALTLARVSSSTYNAAQQSRKRAISERS